VPVGNIYGNMLKCRVKRNKLLMSQKNNASTRNSSKWGMRTFNENSHVSALSGEIGFIYINKVHYSNNYSFIYINIL
jgi:hypothetical protein